MDLLSEVDAIKYARKFLENGGVKIIDCIHVAHATKELYEREMGRPYEHGNFVLEFTRVTPADANYAVKDPRGDVIVVKVNDRTGQIDHMTVLL